MKMLNKVCISFIIIVSSATFQVETSFEDSFSFDTSPSELKSTRRNTIASSVPSSLDSRSNNSKEIYLDNLSKSDTDKDKTVVHVSKVGQKLNDVQDISSQVTSNSKVDQTEEKKDLENQHTVLLQKDQFVLDNDSVVFNFEDADLSNVVSYMEQTHKVKFMSEDVITTAKDAKGLSGHKVSFRTNKNLTKKESWDLFITFLHIAGLDVVPMTQEGFYKIVPFTKTNSEAIQSYIGVDSDVLPDNDMVIRYVYFSKNIDPAKIQPVLTKMQASSAKLDVFSELRALIFTDRASNIKSLMQIVKELDKSVMPQALSVIKLKRANVNDVINLYKSLKPNTSSTASAQQPQRAWVPGKKEPSLDYFPQDVVTVGDPRTNSLILLGDADSVKRIEDFIEQYVDAKLEEKAPPVFTYQLQYTNASDVASLLKNIVQYGSSTTAGQYGGVRDEIKFFQKMTIVPENHSNSLVINATPEDFEALKPLIQELDVAQKQVGLEVLIVQVREADTKLLGAQISGPNGPNAVNDDQKQCQTFGTSISAQTSGIYPVNPPSSPPAVSPIVVTKGGANNEDFSIKSNLARLLCNSVVNEAGSILLTFGKPIWSVFKILKTISSTHIIANPFVVVSNNSEAQVTVGEQRRIVSQEVFGTNTAQGFTTADANLGIKITPQINKGNIVNLKINVENSQFLISGLENPNSALQDKKIVDTYASVANGEVLVLGGLMTETYSSSSRGVPFLEKIPIFGWFFKSKIKSVSRDHFLVFISPKLIDPPRDHEGVDDYTSYKMSEAKKSIDLIEEAEWYSVQKDPIQKAFFGSGTPKSLNTLIGKDKASSKRKKDSKKLHVDKKDSKQSKSKKIKSKTTKDFLSLEQDFMPLENSSHSVKNSITNNIQQDKLGGLYV